MSQEVLGTIINTTQQTVNKMEKDTCSISSDLLISMAKHFNVTTDYILGLSDIKTRFERTDSHESGNGPVL